MSGDSTAEYRRRKDEDEDEDDEVVESLGERTEGKDEKTDGKLGVLGQAYAEKLEARDPKLFEEMGRSGGGDVHHGDASWLTQHHAVETGNDDWETDYKLVVGCSAHSVFEAATEVYKEHSVDVFHESGMEGIEKGVRAVVEDLMKPTTSALKSLGHSGLGVSSLGIASLGESLMRRNASLDAQLRGVLSPLDMSESMYCRVMEDLKDLSGELKFLEARSGAPLGLSVELEARNPEFVAELSGILALRNEWSGEDDDSGAKSAGWNGVLEKASWLQDGGRDDCIWESFQAVREELSDSYCASSADKMARLLFEPVNGKWEWVAERVKDSECIRDLEFDPPDFGTVMWYFKERSLDTFDGAVDSLMSGDRDGFDRSMDGLREIGQELRGIRSGYIPSHPKVDGLSDVVLDALNESREEARKDSEMAAYLLVSLSGHDSQNGVPAWDAEMKALFNQYYYAELLGVAPEGHISEDWPWDSESFQNLKYDGLVNDPAFLEKFREVTTGMLLGESRRGWCVTSRSGLRGLWLTRRTCTRASCTRRENPGGRVVGLSGV